MDGDLPFLTAYDDPRVIFRFDRLPIEPIHVRFLMYDLRNNTPATTSQRSPMLSLSLLRKAIDWGWRCWPVWAVELGISLVWFCAFLSLFDFGAAFFLFLGVSSGLSSLSVMPQLRFWLVLDVFPALVFSPVSSWPFSSPFCIQICASPISSCPPRFFLSRISCQSLY